MLFASCYLQVAFFVKLHDNRTREDEMVVSFSKNPLDRADELSMCMCFVHNVETRILKGDFVFDFYIITKI